MPRTTIFIVEDDAAIRRGLADALGFAGYSVGECARGDRALSALLAAEPDLVLLDIMLPGTDGFTLLEQLRQARPRLPVIMLTARGAEDDRVRGLRLGADDYVVKPFSAKELLARVEAVMRRTAERPTDLRTLELEDRTVLFDRREVAVRDGTSHRLSELESEIVRYLAIHRGRVIERKELLQRVWGGNPHGMETRTIDMHISRLRDKLESDPSNPRYIVTVRAKGYMLTEPDAGRS